MEQARKLQDMIGLFPEAKAGTTIRMVIFLIQKAEYKSEENSAIVDVWYGSPPGIDYEFLTFADYWAEVMGVLQSAPRLGEKAKTVFGFEHALHTYYHLKMNEAEQMQYKGLYTRLVKDLQALTGTILAEARALENSGQLQYVLEFPVLPKGVVIMLTDKRNERNFRVLEDKLFLDPCQLEKLKKFLWSGEAREKKQYITELSGLKYHTSKIAFI